MAVPAGEGSKHGTEDGRRSLGDLLGGGVEDKVIRAWP